MIPPDMIAQYRLSEVINFFQMKGVEPPQMFNYLSRLTRDECIGYFGKMKGSLYFNRIGQLRASYTPSEHLAHSTTTHGSPSLTKTKISLNQSLGKLLNPSPSKPQAPTFLAQLNQTQTLTAMFAPKSTQLSQPMATNLTPVIRTNSSSSSSSSAITHLKSSTHIMSSQAPRQQPSSSSSSSQIATSHDNALRVSTKEVIISKQSSQAVPSELPSPPSTQAPQQQLSQTSTLSFAQALFSHPPKQLPTSSSSTSISLNTNSFKYSRAKLLSLRPKIPQPPLEGLLKFPKLRPKLPDIYTKLGASKNSLFEKKILDQQLRAQTTSEDALELFETAIRDGIKPNYVNISTMVYLVVTLQSSGEHDSRHRKRWLRLIQEIQRQAKYFKAQELCNVLFNLAQTGLQVSNHPSLWYCLSEKLKDIYVAEQGEGSILIFDDYIQILWAVASADASLNVFPQDLMILFAQAVEEVLLTSSSAALSPRRLGHFLWAIWTLDIPLSSAAARAIVTSSRFQGTKDPRVMGTVLYSLAGLDYVILSGSNPPEVFFPQRVLTEWLDSLLLSLSAPSFAFKDMPLLCWQIQAFYHWTRLVFDDNEVNSPTHGEILGCTDVLQSIIQLIPQSNAVPVSSRDSEESRASREEKQSNRETLVSVERDRFSLAITPVSQWPNKPSADHDDPWARLQTEGIGKEEQNDFGESSENIPIPQDSSDHMLLCEWCYVVINDMNLSTQCQSCNKVRYCCPEHLQMAWVSGHQVNCEGPN